MKDRFSFGRVLCERFIITYAFLQVLVFVCVCVQGVCVMVSAILTELGKSATPFHTLQAWPELQGELHSESLLSLHMFIYFHFK